MSETTCPVCGMQFPEEEAEALGAFRLTHKGRAYWLDSSTCAQTFARDADKFLARGQRA